MTPVGLPEAQWHEAEINDFIHAIRTGEQVPSPGEEALMATQIVDAVYRSAQEGREVAL